jgi:SAM-dependent methyltransferase
MRGGVQPCKRHDRDIDTVRTMPKVVITMPAFHAETTLQRTVEAIPDGVADELILVDDASTDATADVARELGLRVHVHPDNRGYGGNQKTCYTLALEADADIVVLLHPDYQYEPKAVPLLIAPILAGEADMTFGSRFAGMGDPLAGGMPLYRYVGNRITTVTQNVLLGTRFTDMHSGMRAYTRRALLTLPFRGYPDGFSFDARLLIDAVTTGVRVVEVPIPTRYTKESSSISVGRSLRYVADGTRYAASAALLRGRRGHRYVPGWRAAADSITVDERPPPACAACGSTDLRLRFPPTATGDPIADEFRCTSDALGLHDGITRCARCHLLSQRPTLEPEALRALYEQVEDVAYLEQEASRREHFEWVLDQIDQFHRSGSRLTEIGAHVGLFLAEAATRGWTATGVEPSAWAVAEGSRRSGVSLRQGAIETLRVRKDSADALVMLDVLEHLVDPVGALRRVHPMLASDGLLVISTINTSGMHARLSSKRWPWFTRAHIHYPGPVQLALMLRRAGFEMVRWQLMPRSMQLSYIAERAGNQPGAAALGRASEVLDPRLPAGLLGDSALICARPMPPGPNARAS